MGYGFAEMTERRFARATDAIFEVYFKLFSNFPLHRDLNRLRVLKKNIF